MLYLRYCLQNPTHYVASREITFSKLGNRKCPFCSGPFGEEIKEVRDFGTAKFITDNEETNKAFEGLDITFGMIIKDDPSKTFDEPQSDI